MVFVLLLSLLFSSFFHFCSHHSAFGPSHALSMLSNFMGVPNIPHSDVLEKLKMQVGLIDPEFALQSLRNLSTPPNSSFNMAASGNDAVSATSAANQPHNLSTLQSSQQKNFPFTTPNAPNTKDGNYVLNFHSLFVYLLIRSIVALNFQF